MKGADLLMDRKGNVGREKERGVFPGHLEDSEEGAAQGRVCLD